MALTLKQYADKAAGYRAQRADEGLLAASLPPTKSRTTQLFRIQGGGTTIEYATWRDHREGGGYLTYQAYDPTTGQGLGAPVRTMDDLSWRALESWEKAAGALPAGIQQLRQQVNRWGMRRESDALAEILAATAAQLTAESQ